MDEYYLIAKILSAGKDGFVKVQFVPGLNISLDSIQLVYVDFWDQKKTIELEEILNFKQSVFFKFKNFDDDRDISVFIGRNMFISKNDYEKVLDDVFVNQDLIGSKVYKGQDFLGIVSDYFETPANPVIEVSKEDGSNFLIPYVDSVFEKIDPENKILILNYDFGIDDDED